MRIPCLVLAIGVSACGHALQPPEIPQAAKAEAERTWRTVRAKHPFYFQGVFAAPASGAYRTVVVTEPPPHATKAAIGNVLGAAGVETRDTQIGYDGWARDVLVVLARDSKTSPAESEDSERDRLEALHEYLFHTSYRAEAYDPFAAEPETPNETLDLRLPLGALHTWLFAPQRRFQGLDGGGFSGTGIATAAAPAVYRADDLGLSLCLLAAHADLSAAEASLRKFALETDLFLGGVAEGGKVALVGRERRLSTERLPPLRTETLLGIAAANDRELSQSYERNNLFAGKLKDGADWAPILLSPELVDGELGGLLDITDQLLKGWSLNGTVHYHNFEYPKPARWAAGVPLDRELGATSLTFNWNTSGAMFQVDFAGAVAVFPPRTGALPIAYIPEGQGLSGIGDIEQRNRDFFARQNDPNLSRAVGYTAFYHVVKAFGLSAGSAGRRSPARSAPRGGAELYLEATARALLEGSTAEHLSAPKTPAQRARVDELKQALTPLREAYGAAGVDEFIHYLAGVSSFPTVEHPHQAVLDFAAKLAPRIARSELAELFDRDAMFREYLKRSQRERRGFVGTPNVVVSRVPDSVSTQVIDGKLYEVRTQYSGGHNLRVAPGTFAVEPGRAEANVVSRGPFDFQAQVDEGYLLADPEALQRLQKELQDGRIDTPRAIELLSLARELPGQLPELPPAPPRPGRAGVGFDAPRLEQGARAAAPNFTVEWQGQSDLMYSARTPDGRSLLAGSTAAMRRQLELEVRGYRKSSAKGPLFFEMLGFPGERAESFLSNLSDHLNGPGDGPRVVFVLERPGIVQRLRRWLAEFPGAPGAKVVKQSELALGDGRVALTYRVELQGRFRTLLVRLRAAAGSLRESATLEALAGWLGKRGDPFAGFCQETRMNIEVYFTKYELPPEDQVELEPNERRARDALRVALRAEKSR